MIKVVIADDHRVVLQGLTYLLDSEDDIEVMGKASDGLEAIEIVEKFNPDVLIIDLMMPNLNGLEASRQISSRMPNIKIIILSMHDSAPYIVKAFNYGVSGYIPKESSAEELVLAIRKVMEGEKYLSSKLQDINQDDIKNINNINFKDPYDSLTNRERHVFQMVAEGKSNSNIANILTISNRTVESHRANINKKLNLKSQTDILRYAIKIGTININE